MGLTFLQMVNRVLGRSNIDQLTGLAGPNENTQRVMDAINDAIVNLSRLHDFGFLIDRAASFVCTSGNPGLVLNTTIDETRKPIKIYRRLPSYFELQEANDEIWTELTGKTTIPGGKPEWWRPAGMAADANGNLVPKIELYPTPNSSPIKFIYEHYRKPPTLTVDADQTYFPDRAVILEATKIYRDLKGDDATSINQQIAMAMATYFKNAKPPPLRQGQISRRYNPNVGVRYPGLDRSTWSDES